MNGPQTYGNLIARARREAGVTQDEFADDIQVRRETVSRWERDMLKYTPPAEELHRVCERLPDLTEYKLLWALHYNLKPLVDDGGNPALFTTGGLLSTDALTRQELELVQSYRQLTPGLRRVMLVQVQATAHDLRDRRPPES